MKNVYPFKMLVEILTLGFIFLLAIRIFNAYELSIFGWQVPSWLSAIVFVICIVLLSRRLNFKKPVYKYISPMKPKTFTVTAGVIFSIEALLHLIRGLMGWDLVFAGWNIPLWTSALAIGVLGFLAVQGFVLGGRKRQE